MSTTKMMNELVEAKFKTQAGNIVKIYRHSEGKTGVCVASNTPDVYDVDVESVFSQFAKNKKHYKLVETTRQVKERVLGNADEAYKVMEYD